MANHSTKQIGRKPEEKTVSKMDTLHDAWSVMKPFVKFSVKAMKLLTHALIYIVRHIPKPEESKPGKKDKVIRI
ncbi:MAG TPA: hypothetical protein VHA56_21915 [Mucilaginibacter sp.]|nr:hypothetical protein [Mucilaginibacter sp.]